MIISSLIKNDWKQILIRKMEKKFRRKFEKRNEIKSFHQIEKYEIPLIKTYQIKINCITGQTTYEKLIRNYKHIWSISIKPTFKERVRNVF